jgi:Regulator of Vps4 activity in the MVB pathway
LKEPIASVVFSAPRCADVPELSDVTKQFQAKYGKEFIISALELRPGSGVSQLVCYLTSMSIPKSSLSSRTLCLVVDSLQNLILVCELFTRRYKFHQWLKPFGI